MFPKISSTRMDTQHLYIDLKEGKQHLNGEQAVHFLRFRHDKYGDVGRIQRQQTLMRALIEQTLNPATIGRLPKILSVIQSHIDTNLSVEELVALMGFGAQTKRADVQMLLLPGQFNGTGQQEVSYWLPSRRRIKQIMAQHFDVGYNKSNEVDPTFLRIAIQDSTDDPEAVQTLVSQLKEAGYRKVYVAEEWKEPLQVTRIIAQQGDEVGANAIREDLGFGETRVESTGRSQLTCHNSIG